MILCVLILFKLTHWSKEKEILHPILFFKLNLYQKKWTFYNMADLTKISKTTKKDNPNICKTLSSKKSDSCTVGFISPCIMLFILILQFLNSNILCNLNSVSKCKLNISGPNHHFCDQKVRNNELYLGSVLRLMVNRYALKCRK